MLLALALLSTLQQPAAATPPAADTLPRPSTGFSTLMRPGGADEDRLRVDQLLGRADATGFLIRSPSTLSPGPEAPRTGVAVTALAPELLSVWNSTIPVPFNDGALRAGRGTSLRISTGLRARYGPAELVLAPEVLYEENAPFQVLPYPQQNLDGRPPRSVWAHPYHHPPETLDAPLRFGPGARAAVGPGQSSLTVAAGRAAFGAATENLWWGPGIRNAIVMSSHAPGIPHLFVRTRDPLRTRLGTVDARWILGSLAESDYFDDDPANDHRSISALALAIQPAFDPGLTVGLARAVYAAAGSALPLGAALDVFRNVGRPGSTPDAEAVEPGPDQVFTAFGRWVLPEAGFETYVEWARYEQPKSLRDLLEMPNHSQGFTLGLQWARPLADSAAAVRLQGELTYLEPSTSFRVRPVRGWYTSRAVPQGYTHHGRVIGAGIGSAASSQWLALDRLGDRWEIGAFGGRIRWDAQVVQLMVNEFRETDVSLYAGLRGGIRWGGVRLHAEYRDTMRLNYLFQARLHPDGIGHDGVDIRNRTVRVGLSYVPDAR